MNEQRMACQTRAGTALVWAVRLLAAVILAAVAVALAAGRADAQESFAADSDGYVPTYYSCFAGGGVGYYSWYNDGYTTYGEVTVDSCLMDSLGAGPADYDRVLAHEQGHAAGLGHSSDPNDIMYPYHTFVAAEVPAIEEPVIEEPMVETPVAQELVIEEPVAEHDEGVLEIQQAPVQELPATGGHHAASDGSETVTVESGDTLSGIAEEIFGDAGQWEALFEANQDQISDPDLIFPEQALLVKAEETTAPTPAVAPEPIQNEEAAAETEEPADTTQADAYQYEQPSIPAPQEQASGEAAPGNSLPELQEEEELALEEATPSGTAMNLTVPALGISGVPVIDENSEAALTAGAMHLPGTGFPWQGEGSNTYVAGHRIGYPGTPSDRVFYDLPSMQQGDEVVLTDADGKDYTYAVTEIFAVTPSDTYVTSPIAGRDVVTLQTCTETPDDWTTIGPRLLASGPESGRLIVRADRVA